MTRGNFYGKGIAILRVRLEVKRSGNKTKLIQTFFTNNVESLVLNAGCDILSFFGCEKI